MTYPDHKSYMSVLLISLALCMTSSVSAQTAAGAKEKKALSVQTKPEGGPTSVLAVQQKSLPSRTKPGSKDTSAAQGAGSGYKEQTK